MRLRAKAIIALVALGAWVPAQAHVIVAPTVLKLTQGPDETGQALLTVTNQRDSPQNLTVEPEYWYQGRCRSQVGDWLTIEPVNLTVPAQGQAEFTLKARTPAGLDGECLVMVYLARKETGVPIAVKTRVGIPLYLRAVGTDRVEAEISGFWAAPPVEGEANTRVVLAVHNLGNLHLVPFGLVTFTALDGTTVRTKSFQFREPIFAGETRELRMDLDRDETPTRPRQAAVQVYLANLYEGQERALQDRPLTRTCKLP